MSPPPPSIKEYFMSDISHLLIFRPLFSLPLRPLIPRDLVPCANQPRASCVKNIGEKKKKKKGVSNGRSQEQEEEEAGGKHWTKH